MPTRLIQNEQHAPGTAAFQVMGPAAAALSDPEDIEIAIVQPGPTERYLDPRNPDDPWSTSVYRFRPLDPRRQGPSLLLDIDYGVSYHLRANQPYKLQLRQGGGPEIEEVFTVPASLRRPTTRPQGWTPPPGPRGPLEAPLQAAEVPPPPPPSPPPPPPAVIEPPPPPMDVFAEPLPEPEPVVDIPVIAEPPPVPPVPGRPKWLIPLVVVLVLAAGAAGYFFVPVGAPAVVDTMDSCRKLVASKPEPAAARTKADALANDGKLLDCQFLLYKFAGEKGDRDAARTLGAFYDPDTWSKDKSPLPAPNPIEAARWHKQAAEAGDAESQYRYGMLLKLGRTDATDGPEQAQVWLRKAAEQGQAQAKDALAQ